MSQKFPTEARPLHANQRRHPALHERGRPLNQQRRQTVAMKVQKSYSAFLTLRLVKCLRGTPTLRHQYLRAGRHHPGTMQRIGGVGDG